MAIGKIKDKKNKTRIPGIINKQKPRQAKNKPNKTMKYIFQNLAKDFLNAVFQDLSPLAKIKEAVIQRI